MEDARFYSYLQNEKIESKLEIDENGIKFSSTNTIYIQIQKDKPEELKSILQQFKEFKKLANSKGLRVVDYNKAVNYVKENYDSYLKSCIWCNNFIDIVAELLEHIQARGLHYGTCDDKELRLAQDNINQIVKARNDILNPRHQVENLIFNLYSNMDFLKNAVEPFGCMYCI